MLRNISDVRGFKCWGAHMGIKSKRRDLALIWSETPANAASVFTQNQVVAEPVKLSREHIKGGICQAIIINSGNANAITGKQGWKGAVAMAEKTAELLNIPKETVLVGSTGLIGEPFPTEKVLEGIEECVQKLSNRMIAGSLAANAILTTDTFAKEGFTSFKVGEKNINMAGIAKGSGMIHPNMGTMLAYICCDAAIAQPLLDKALRRAVNKTFNMITIDGDTSTNDMVSILCNGMAENEEITDENSEEYALFYDELEELCRHLAKLIVSDGEGSTKIVEYRVEHAATLEEARTMVHTVMNSNLVKTAIFGTDPNWGRILMAAGNSGVDFDPDKLDLYIGTNRSIKILEQGQPISQDRSELKKEMQSSNITIVIDLHGGKESAVGWGCDLSYEYVRINAEYTT